MTIDNPVPQPDARKQSWLSGVWNVFSSGIARPYLIAVAGICAALWVNPFNYLGQQTRPDVAQRWNDGIATLGIEPIYPMTEDVKFGDVFVRVSDKGLTEKQKTDERIKRVLYRSVRIARLKLTTEDQQTPRYAETERCTPKQLASNDCPLLNGIDTPVIQPGTNSSLEPTIVGFPTIRLSLSGSALIDILPAGLRGIGAAASEVIAIAIPEAYTIGSSPLDATVTLLDFCTHKQTKEQCSLNLNRLLLASAFRGPVQEPIGKIADKECFLQMEISIVTRTYFTREIVVSHETKNSKSVTALFSTTVTEPAEGPDGKSGKPPAVASNSEQVIGTSVRFRRPVVFGYRSATFALDKFFAKDSSEASEYPPCSDEDGI